MRDTQHRIGGGGGGGGGADGGTGGAARLNNNAPEQGARDLRLPHDSDPSSIKMHISVVKHK